MRWHGRFSWCARHGENEATLTNYGTERLERRCACDDALGKNGV